MNLDLREHPWMVVVAGVIVGHHSNDRLARVILRDSDENQGRIYLPSRYIVYRKDGNGPGLVYNELGLLAGELKVEYVGGANVHINPQVVVHA